MSSKNTNGSDNIKAHLHFNQFIVNFGNEDDINKNMIFPKCAGTFM